MLGPGSTSTSPSSFVPEVRPPKSPRRFFSSLSSFSAVSHPPLPTHTTSASISSASTSTLSRKGSAGVELGGATVVRTPEEALLGVKKSQSTSPSAVVTTKPTLNHAISTPNISTVTRPIRTSSRQVIPPSSSSSSAGQTHLAGESFAATSSTPDHSSFHYISPELRPGDRPGMTKSASHGTLRFDPHLHPQSHAQNQTHRREKGHQRGKLSIGLGDFTPSLSLSPSFTPATATSTSSTTSQYSISSPRTPSARERDRGSDLFSNETSPFRPVHRPSFTASSRRSTIKPQQKYMNVSLPPSPTSLPSTASGSGKSSNFSAILLDVTSKSLHNTNNQAEVKDTTLVTIQFAYSLSDPPNNHSITLPTDVLVRAGQSHLLDFVNTQLPQRQAKSNSQSEAEGAAPEMTDGESADDTESGSGSEEEYEYGLDALLRDEYLQSLMIANDDDPTLVYTPRSSKPPIAPSSKAKPEGWKRAQTRNQYTQLLHKFPLPSQGVTIDKQVMSSSTLPLNIRRRAPVLSVLSESPPPPPLPPKPPKPTRTSTHTEIRLLIFRDAAPWHHLAHILLRPDDTTPRKVEGSLRERMKEECHWAGMYDLARTLMSNTSTSIGYQDEQTRQSASTSPRDSGTGTRGLAPPPLQSPPRSTKSKPREKSFVLRGGQGYI